MELEKKNKLGLIFKKKIKTNFIKIKKKILKINKNLSVDEYL